MPQSLSAVCVHAVFSTKNRLPLLHDAAVRTEMHRYLAGISNRLDCPALEVGGVADHVHVLAYLGRSISQADWVKELKRASAIWLKKFAPQVEHFAWQAGYGLFSVSASQTAKARQYIANQEAHHQKVGFQDELRTLLQVHGLEWSEEYLWE